MLQKTRPLRWVLLFPVLSAMLIFAVAIGFILFERLHDQAYLDAIASAQAQADKGYALLRGRFEYQLLSSQGNQSRYKELQAVVQEESVLLLKSLMRDWQGTLAIRDMQADWAWLWNGQSWQYTQHGSVLVDDEWLVRKDFLPWQWQVQVRPNVTKITAEVQHSEQLLLVLIVGLWLLSAFLLWWRLQHLVLKPMANILNFLAHLSVDQQTSIHLTGSQDMAILATQLNQLSKRLYEQHIQLTENMRTLAEDRTYMRAVLDAQPAMTLLTNGIEMIDANDALLRFFPQFSTLDAFKQAHHCICDLFINHKDPLGYLYFEHQHPNWVNLALACDYRVLMRKEGVDHHFMVRTRRFDYQGMAYFTVVFDDISGHVEAEMMMQQQLVTDMTTELPNRVKLIKDMTTYSPQGILLVKILEFGRLNEVYGIQFGDAYLRSFSERLREECHQLPGLIGPYRLSGSEFAYQLFDDEADAAVWQSRANWLLTDLNQRDLVVWGARIPVMVAGGFSLWDEEVDDEEQLLLQAAMAINRARKQHLLVLEYDADWRERQRYQQAQEWLEKVRQALAEDRIEPVFQPIYNQSLGVVDKYECLVRLRDHQDALIAPGLFLDAVRHTREYLHLTQVMFKKSCALFSGRDEFFTLNLAEDDFRHGDHLKILLDLVRHYEVGHRLTLEVLESEEITSYEQMLMALAPFRALGCSVAIDDFGSGYANFAHIAGLQAQVLKIDGSLIQAMEKDISKENVVLGLVEFAHRMGLLVVAEFVSNDDLWQRLAKMGVDGIQGYAVSPPVQAEIVGYILANKN
jgi:EAL domain-containing protein (putative c-di-GMP-specific phosphodiesterase class I)/GGDEF domain-containing protein